MKKYPVSTKQCVSENLYCNSSGWRISCDRVETIFAKYARLLNASIDIIVENIIDTVL